MPSAEFVSWMKNQWCAGCWQMQLRLITDMRKHISHPHYCCLTAHPCASLVAGLTLWHTVTIQNDAEWLKSFSAKGASSFLCSLLPQCILKHTMGSVFVCSVWTEGNASLNAVWGSEMPAPRLQLGVCGSEEMQMKEKEVESERKKGRELRLLLV